MSFKFICEGLFSKLNTFNTQNVVSSANNFHTTVITAFKINRFKDQTSMLRTVGKKRIAIRGEDSFDMDSPPQGQRLLSFSDAGFSADRLFEDLPICSIQTSKNNTTVTLTDKAGKVLVINSFSGFRNFRKGTNIAEQATAITVGKKALQKGVHKVRVVVRGIGPGRASSIKGLQMAGLNVVSITDATRVSDIPPRPRKIR